MISITNSIKRILPFFIGVITLILVVFAISRIIDRSDGIVVKTFRVTGGWGYQIMVNDKVYIYQPFMPGVAGGKPFEASGTARRTGRLVEEKLRKGINPAVSSEELKKILEE
jgi:hypothetical protein